MASELKLYTHTAIFGLITFGIIYGYLTFLEIPNQLNKSVADTAIVLMGWSMLLSSVCYFWNFLDKLIVYRKYLGLIGYAFAVTHVLLSWSLFLRLFAGTTWAAGIPWAPFTGLLATIIFTVMALISNNFMAAKLGGRMWKFILRTGYLAVILVAAHVTFLKGARWLTWYQEGMPELPSMSLLVTLFMAVVVLMRIALWVALKFKKTTPPAQTVKPSATATLTNTVTETPPVASQTPPQNATPNPPIQT